MSLNLNIPNLVGRRWGGRARGFSGPVGDGYYGVPRFAAEEVVELSPGVPVRITTRPRAATVLSGLGTGRPDRELADLGALIAPGSSGLTVKTCLGPDRQLHVSICIDGECYEGSVDLSEVLEHIASGIASHHTALHAAPPHDVADDPGAVEGTANAANAAVEAAGDLVVGALIDQHSTTLSAGWWHSLTHAIYDVHHAVAKTVQKFKAPITIAATAVATAYGGPAAGAAASKFAGPLIDAVADDFQTRKNAKAVVEAAHAAAQSDPRMARALADAHKAVADTAAAYHLTSTAADAASGDPSAARKLVDLDRAATSGDTAAQRALSVITQAFSAAGDGGDGDPTTTGATPVVPFALGVAAGIGGSTWWRRYHARKAQRAAAAIQNPATAPPSEAPAPPASPAASSGELIGAAITTLRRAAKAAVVSAHQQQGATALGYVQDAHRSTVMPFPSLDDADDWFGALDPRHYLYAAYFDATDPTWPAPINEQLGGPAAASAHAHVSEAAL
jgi:hypothetical protein